MTRQTLLCAPLVFAAAFTVSLVACTSSEDSNTQACEMLHDLCPTAGGSEQSAACHELTHDGSPDECAAQLDACALACGGDESADSSEDETDGGEESDATGEETETEGEDDFPEMCWTAQRECDPRTAEPCGAGETCDIGSVDGTPALTCFPPPNTAQLGDACDSQSGPFCSAGLVCGSSATCVPFCCGDEECAGADEICEPLAEEYGTLGACVDPNGMPDCSPAGAACVDNSDCCSNDCHSNHCH